MIKLPFEFFKKKNNLPEEYLGVFLKESEGVVFFLQSNGSDLRKIAQEKFTYTNSWDNLAEDLDEVLYRLELQSKKAPDKTIFFVYSHLVDQHTGQIEKEYLNKIKSISKNLELKPLGYIECHESVVNHIQKKEGINLNALVIEFDKSTLEVFHYKNGKREHAEKVPKTNDLIADLLPVLDKIRSKNVLPARIILYNSKDLDLEVTKILSHRWEANHFSQLPKIEVVKEHDMFEGLIAIFADQLSAGASKETPKVEEKKEVMGFTVGGETPVAEPEKPAQIQEQPQEQISDIPTPAVEEKRKAELNPTMLVGPALSVVSNFSKKFQGLFKNLKLPSNAILPIAGALVLVLIVFLLEFFSHKANVTIFLPSQSVSSNIQLDVPQDQVVEKTVSPEFKVSKTTSGKRDVGEKAKGAVTIHNFDDKEVIFREGTVISTGDLKFLLDNDVKVASSSLAPDGSAKLPGKGQGKVTAKEIGSEGNVEKNKKFEIEGLSPLTYFAINDDAFSGGTKKQVKTVAKEDIEALKDKALKEADKYEAERVVPKIGKENELLKPLTSIKLSNSSYSHELGEEAGTLELKTKANITYDLLKKDVLLKEVGDSLTDKVKKGYKIKPEDIQYKIKSVEENKDDFTIEASVKARASQDIKKEDLLKKIAGANSKKVEDNLKEQYQSKIEFEIKDLIPFFKNRFPWRKGNIDLQVTYL